MLTFSVNQDVQSVLLTTNLGTAVPKTQEGFEWLSEAWIKALEGKTGEEINVDAYGYVCKENTMKAKNKREASLLTVDEVNESESGYVGVADTVASYVDNRIEAIVESSEVKTIVNEFIEYHDYLLIEEGVSLWKLLTVSLEDSARQMNGNSRRNTTSSVQTLVNVVKRLGIEELIQNIIERKECMVALKGAMA